MAERKVIARCIHRVYKLTLSPFIGRFCRFHPSCSDYALEAVEKHGWVRGGLVSLKRFFRCRPGCTSGFDPVP